MGALRGCLVVCRTVNGTILYKIGFIFACFNFSLLFVLNEARFSYSLKEELAHKVSLKKMVTDSRVKLSFQIRGRGHSNNMRNSRKTWHFYFFFLLKKSFLNFSILEPKKHVFGKWKKWHVGSVPPKCHQRTYNYNGSKIEQKVSHIFWMRTKSCCRHRTLTLFLRGLFSLLLIR
jgi:hypothetical protein